MPKPVRGKHEKAGAEQEHFSHIDINRGDLNIDLAHFLDR
jgi:hypothetical protein